MATLSAKQTSVQNAAKVGNEPFLPIFGAAAKVRSDVLLAYGFVADLIQIAIEIGNGRP